MKRKHLFHSFVFLMTGLVTLAFGHVAQADNTTTAESSTINSRHSDWKQATVL